MFNNNYIIIEMLVHGGFYNDEIYNDNNEFEYFNMNKKKDDLSDAFLQGLWFINNKKL